VVLPKLLMVGFVMQRAAPLQLRNATTTFEQIGAAANLRHQSTFEQIGTVMPEGEEKEYCFREGRGEEEEKGGSRIWCPN